MDTSDIPLSHEMTVRALTSLPSQADQGRRARLTSSSRGTAPCLGRLCQGLTALANERPASKAVCIHLTVHAFIGLPAIHAERTCYLLCVRMRILPADGSTTLCLTVLVTTPCGCGKLALSLRRPSRPTDKRLQVQPGRASLASCLSKARDVPRLYRVYVAE
jgi:hypothetical protein